MIMRRIAPMFLLSVCLMAWPTCLCSQDLRKPFTVADSIGTTHVLYNESNDPVLISPNRKKFLVVLEWGDLARNGSWVELVLGSTRSIETASRAHVVARIFSKSTARASDLIKNVRWLADNERITFLWDDGKKCARIVSVNTETRRIDTLVQHSTPIVKYDISQDGQTIVFLAQSPRNTLRDAELERLGFAVTDQPLRSILHGDFDGWTPGSRYQTFVVSRPGKQPRRIRESGRVWSTTPELLLLSPNAHYALLVRPAEEIPQTWDAYTEHVFKDIYLSAARNHVRGPNYIRQYFIVDITRGIVRPLWNAPENPSGDAVWSTDSRRVVIGPTFLPVLEANDVGLSGGAVAEVDVLSGQFDCLPLSGALGTYYRPVRWSEDGILEVAGESEGSTKGNSFFKKVSGKWNHLDDETRTARSRSGVRIELRQDPNTPPALYAVNETGAERLIRELNPELRKEVTLGHVDSVHWSGGDGRTWTGLLYYPVHYQSGRTYPLVVQTHGYSTQEFSPDGSFTTVFAAQELANRDIAVLQVGSPDSGMEDIAATPSEPRVYMSGFEGAINHFVKLGLAEPGKVGIVGFSRTGWLVEYMITHSSIPLAAAEVADNIDGSYFQYVTDSDGNRVFDEKGNGARPFGSGLATWALAAPGFNVDRVHTPLRMEVDSGPIDEILSAWEMFSNLRYLRKPVELVVIPDIQHGVHILQNPRQRLASQGGTVDWFCFWLKDEEDPDPAKSAQYARWHELRNLNR